ncbi:hypothetical protein [Sphingomonas sp. PB1R3]|uniref:hypothetical protein n=1 Tax=Sphingomonas flavida TaxID=3096154 RepID=UPI002FCB6D81
MGKLIDFVWKEWGVEPKGYARNAHDRRQRAVACLLIVADLYPHAKEMAGKGGIDEADLQSRVKAILPTKPQKSTFWVIMGGMEKFKHLAMYVDESNENIGVNAFAIKPEHVQNVLEVLEPALGHLREPHLLRSSAVVWEQAGKILAEMKAEGQRYFENVSPLDASV